MALHLGGTVDSLSRIMTESEFVNWQRFAAKRMLPKRLLQLQLAQISLMIARTMGGNSEATLSDFLFDPIEEDDSEEAAAEFFGFTLGNKKE